MNIRVLIKATYDDLVIFYSTTVHNQNIKKQLFLTLADEISTDYSFLSM